MFYMSLFPLFNGSFSWRVRDVPAGTTFMFLFYENYWTSVHLSILPHQSLSWSNNVVCWLLHICPCFHLNWFFNPGLPVSILLSPVANTYLFFLPKPGWLTDIRRPSVPWNYTLPFSVLWYMLNLLLFFAGLLLVFYEFRIRICLCYLWFAGKRLVAFAFAFVSMVNWIFGCIHQNVLNFTLLFGICHKYFFEERWQWIPHRYPVLLQIFSLKVKYFPFRYSFILSICGIWQATLLEGILFVSPVYSQILL